MRSFIWVSETVGNIALIFATGSSESERIVSELSCILLLFNVIGLMRDTLRISLNKQFKYVLFDSSLPGKDLKKSVLIPVKVLF